MGWLEIDEAADNQGDPRSVRHASGWGAALSRAPLFRRGRSARGHRDHGERDRAPRRGHRDLPLLLLGLIALLAAGCAGDEEEAAASLQTRGDLIETIAGEPLYREDVEALKEAHQLSEDEALGLGKIYALLAAEARSRSLVDETKLKEIRRRALVQLYLDEKRAGEDALDEAEVNARYFSYPEGERPSMESLREQMKSERTFRLILEEIEALTGELSPSIDPSRLPAPSELFVGEATP